MRKRLFFTGVMAAILALPAFAQEDTPVVPLNGVENPGQNVENPVQNIENNNDATTSSEMRCDSETLLVSSGDVAMDAIWNLISKSCDSGKYFDKTSVDCAVCLENHYCPGGEDFSVESTDNGLVECPESHPYANGSSSAKNSCYKTDSISCSVKNPYTHGHGTAVYTNESFTCNTYFGADADCTNESTNACDYTLNCDTGYVSKTVNGVLKCVNEVSCDAGTYLPAGQVACAECPADHYCEGGTFNVSDSDAGINSCNGLKSPAGSIAATDCGRILHIGDNKLYLHSDAEHKTSPALVVDINGDRYYADITPVVDGVGKPISNETDESLHVDIEGVEYTIHTRSH